VNRLRVALRILAGREPAADLTAEYRDLRRQILALSARYAARLEDCRTAAAAMHAWINADPVRARDWHDSQARHPVRVTPRRTR
jgi:hypothetical protein